MTWFDPCFGMGSLRELPQGGSRRQAAPDRYVDAMSLVERLPADQRRVTNGRHGASDEEA